MFWLKFKVPDALFKVRFANQGLSAGILHCEASLQPVPTLNQDRLLTHSQIKMCHYFSVQLYVSEDLFHLYVHEEDILDCMPVSHRIADTAV
jgi:hypothetical protein